MWLSHKSFLYDTLPLAYSVPGKYRRLASLRLQLASLGLQLPVINVFKPSTVCICAVCFAGPRCSGRETRPPGAPRTQRSLALSAGRWQARGCRHALCSRLHACPRQLSDPPKTPSWTSSSCLLFATFESQRQPMSRPVPPGHIAFVLLLYFAMLFFLKVPERRGGSILCKP